MIKFKKTKKLIQVYQKKLLLLKNQLLKNQHKKNQLLTNQHKKNKTLKSKEKRKKYLR